MRLSPDKQKKLAIVVVLGLAVLGSGYYFGFRWIHLEKTKTAEREQMLRGELQKTKRIIDSADQADEKTEAIRKSLAGMRDGL
ncbi:MAG: hypothetical protein JO317_00505, partial [Verrucomicrobiae bacterium]|nr:hypothetical protein [Verrucomicrobiae bacterium]